LGEATAQLLSAEGATVVLGARRQDRITALAETLMRAGGKALAVTMDVTDRAQVKRLVDAAVRTFGRVDVMINNAGLMPQAPLELLKVDEWDRMIDVRFYPQERTWFSGIVMSALCQKRTLPIRSPRRRGQGPSVEP
jgi:NADP-dependent 3-hydroxy acid dehydrogenase YdfG